MKPYPRYKSTGLAWLPSVPEHWEATKIRTIFTERTTKVSDKDYPPLSVSKGGVVPQIETVAKSDNSDNRKLVRIGDFVINSRSDRKGSSGVSELDGSVSLVNLVLKPRKKGNGRFLHYLLKSDPFVEEFYRNGHGIVADLWTTRYSEMKSIYIPLPPPSEQDRIVRYLDEKTAAIDELVRAKERQIELLRERKQTLISAAVTGRDISTKCPLGRDASTMRPRCGRAMGASLPVYRLKELVRFFKGLNITKADLIPEGANVISYGQIHSKDNDGRSLKDSFLRHTSFELTNEAARLSFGDIVFADTSEDQAGIGNCVLNDRHDPVWAGYHTVTARPRNPEIAPYLTILFQSNWWRDQLRRNSDGVKVYSVTQRSLGNTWVALPPRPEQRRIVAYLDSACSELDAAEVAIRKQISLLQELRTRLVSDAVTGAVEV